MMRVGSSLAVQILLKYQLFRRQSAAAAVRVTYSPVSQLIVRVIEVRSVHRRRPSRRRPSRRGCTAVSAPRRFP